MTRTPETKSAGAAPSEIRSAMRDFLGAFEQFKEANDARIAALETGRGDVLLAEKVDRIDAALTEQKSAMDRMALAARRPGLDGAPTRAPDERKAAFARYMRAGDAGALHALEEKSVASASTTTGPEGGYLAPIDTERMIAAAVKSISPIRQIATVREIGSTTFRKPVSKGELAAGWAAETAARPQTDVSTLAGVDIPTAELYAMPAASQALLDDAIVDVEQWLADEVQAEFAAQETAAFVDGDGTAKPKGFLRTTSQADGTQGFGEIGYIATGAAGDFAATNPVDVLFDLIYAPKQTYRANARFVMNRSTVSRLRKFKDKDDRYLWQPAPEAGAEASLLGFPITEAEDMPAIAADSLSIAFGDFARGYLIVDRVGVRVLRDPYSAKPYVLFYTTKRVGGGVQDADAIKFLKFSET
ncbi:MAG: phage major capsid protein [Pseudomonadota bacterium]